MTFYHYTGLNGLMGIIESKTLWATNAYYLNDMSELEYAINLCGRLIDERSRHVDKKLKKELVFIAKYITIVRDFNIFVASFSENPDSLSQWRAYGKGTTGVCIGFPEVIFNLSPDKKYFKLKKCIYDRNEQEKLVTDWLDNTVDHISLDISDARKLKDVRYFAFAHFIDLAPTLKDPSFKEEAEWRLISNAFYTARGIVKYRAGKSMLIPYYEYRLCKPNEDVCINNIVVGPCPNAELSRNAIQGFIATQDVKYASEVNNSLVPYREW